MQIPIAVAALGWLLLAPPASGQIMLLPLTPHAVQLLPAAVLHGETRLIGPGPLPGSLLVEARRADLAGLLLDHATLALASPEGGCGAETGR